MALQMLAAVVVLSVCGLRLVESAPRWTSTPYNNKKVYQLNGGSFTFVWSYNENGSPLDFTQWSKTTMSNDDPPQEIHKAIARRNSDGTTNTAPVFQSRVTFTPGASVAGFQIRNLTSADNAKFTCQLNFQNFDLLSDSAEVVVVVPPVITKKLNIRTTINEGQTFNIPCAASGNPKPKIRWLRNGIEIQYLLNHYGYNITNAGKKDKGLYRCEAIVRGGTIVKTTSYEVNIIVKYKPEVTFITGNQSFTENLDVEIECTAVGEPPVTRYHWYKGKGTSPDDKISTGGKYIFTDNKMKITTLKKDDTSWYTCAAENEVGIGLGKSTYVTTLYPPKEVAVHFKPSNPVNISETLKIICVSDGMPLPTYTWKFNGIAISGSGDRNKKIVRASITRQQAGNYTCLAKNAHGSREATEILHTRYKPTQAEFNTGMPNIGAVMGSPSTLTCKADGYPPPKYILKKDGTVIPGDQGIYTFPQLVTLGDEKIRFSCTPHNMMGQGPEIEGSITVLVTPSFMSNLPTTKQVRAENETKNYTCIADAKPAAQMLWTINNENVTENTTYLGSVFTFSTVSDSNSKYQRTESTLVLNPVNWRMAGNISCIPYNDAGKRKQTTILEVKHRPVVMFPKDSPKNSTLNAGQTVTFTCKANGNPPTTSYVWRFKDVIIPGESSPTFSKTNIAKDDEGKYSCSGVNSRGEGPQAYAYLFIKTPAKINYAPASKANVTGIAVLECLANGVPKPNITWTREGSNTILHKGERFRIVNVTYEDGGIYICSAKNELNIDQEKVTLIVQVKPDIISNKPMDTQIAGEIGKDTSIRCAVKAIPYATIWWTRGSDSAVLNARSDRVKSLNIGNSELTLVITVSYFGEKYYCHARNLLGYVSQQFTIRSKGPPDAPQDLIVRGIRVPKKRTVDVNLTWTPGYSGGEQQFFTVMYKLNSVQSEVFTKIVIDNAAGAQYTIEDLKPYTGYVFKIRPRNSKGLGQDSEIVYYTTPASMVPPARGSMSVTRLEGGTQFEITWTMNENVTHTYLQYREVEVRARREDVRWNDVVGAQGLPRNVTKFLIVNLNADKTYQFRILFKETDESGFNEAMVVESDIIYPVVQPEKRTGLRENELIAIIAACAGVLLILIVVLCLCCCKKRKKPYGADSVQMSQAASGPNLFSYGDNDDNGRRSYATESIEDDPFIEAHIANEMKKKKRPSENGINHGYASQGSMRQPEMLLNPGSRPGMRGISQSQPQLDARGGYSSSGPQRNFATLPAYHEPPTFEEAVRQSVKKQAMSTGDLTGTRAGPPYGRSRPVSPDSDSTSDAEPLSRRPMFKVRPIDEATDHRYTSAPVLQSPIESPVRRPPVVYARPQKKVYDGYPVDMFGSPQWDFMDQDDHYHHEAETGWPPPQYTPGERTIPGMEDDYEPRVNKRRPISGDILELDDYPYGGRDNLPDLPPRMPELSNSRGQMYKEPLGETLPEPPSFLRDVGYEDDEDEIDSAPYHPRSFTEPRNRGRQPYVNIHGQLVRPGSPGREPAYGTERREPIYANDAPRLVAPEPEVPVNQRRNRAPSADSSETDHKPGYVSSGFLV